MVKVAVSLSRISPVPVSLVSTLRAQGRGGADGQAGGKVLGQLDDVVIGDRHGNGLIGIVEGREVDGLGGVIKVPGDGAAVGETDLEIRRAVDRVGEGQGKVEGAGGFIDADIVDGEGGGIVIQDLSSTGIAGVDTARAQGCGGADGETGGKVLGQLDDVVIGDRHGNGLIGIVEGREVDGLGGVIKVPGDGAAVGETDLEIRRAVDRVGEGQGKVEGAGGFIDADIVDGEGGGIVIQDLSSTGIAGVDTARRRVWRRRRPGWR